MKNETTKRNLCKKLSLLVVLAVWSVIVFGMIGCIGQQTETPDTTITLPPVVVTDVVTIPATTVEVVIPAETVTVTNPGGLDAPPVTITADPITVTTQVPAKTIIQTVTVPAQTVVVPSTTTQYEKITITTDRVIITEITVKGDPIVITTTIPVTMTTTKQVCPSGYLIKPGYEGLGCIYFEDAKDLSIGGDTIGGVSVGLLAFVALILGIFLYQHGRRSK